MTSSIVYSLERGARSRPKRKASSSSATFIRLVFSGSVAPLVTTRSAGNRPASGSSTPMCACPSRLVAAIFQPKIGFALRDSINDWIA
jgi:hypothetical protein